MSNPSSPPPDRIRVSPDWSHYDLHCRVKDSLYSLPSHFRTSTFIQGISATDIFTLNSALGATIESQVVTTLNGMRAVWDPDEKYLLYSFVRQSQTFPDVILRKSGQGEGEEVIFGIELKGWYLLAKEAEPSFRFQVTPESCAEADLICVVPWSLDNVISGSPQVFTPYLESSKYAALYRNFHWTHLRASTDSVENRSVISPPGAGPYPSKSDAISDRPVRDGGKNFGRYARTGLMEKYLGAAMDTQLNGVSARHWLEFFKIFKEQTPIDEITREIEKLRNKYQVARTENTPVEVILTQCEKLLGSDQ